MIGRGHAPDGVLLVLAILLAAICAFLTVVALQGCAPAPVCPCAVDAGGGPPVRGQPCVVFVMEGGAPLDGGPGL